MTRRFGRVLKIDTNFMMNSGFFMSQLSRVFGLLFLFCSGLTAADCSALQLSILSPSQGFTIQLGQKTNVTVQFLDGCKNPIAGGKPGYAQLTLVFSTPEPPQSLIDQGNGIWQVVWTPRVVAPQVTLTVEGVEEQGLSVVGATQSVPGSVAAPPPPPTPPSLALGAQSVSLSTTAGGSAASQQLLVQDNGGGSLPFTAAAASDTGWLTVTPGSGVAASSTPGPLTVSAAPGALVAGSYTGSVSVTSGGNTVSVPVNFTIVAPPASLQVSQANLTFVAGASGATGAAPQTVVVSNGSGGSIAWVASAATSNGGNWLQLSPSSGTAPASSSLTVSVNASGLSPGSYAGTITVTSPQAGTAARSVSVSLTVLNVQPQSSPSLAVDSSGMALSAAQGSGPVSQVFHVTNSGGGVLNYTLSASTNSGGAWISLSAVSGSAAQLVSNAITATLSPGLLSPGAYTGQIVVTDSTGKAVTIPVTFTITAQQSANLLLSQAGLSFTTVAQGGAPLPQSFGIQNTGGGSMTWTASVSTNAGGLWLQASPTSGAVTRPNLDVSLVSVSVNTSGLAAGVYFGKVSIQSSQAANAPGNAVIMLTVLPAGQTVPPQVYPTGLIFTSASAQTIQVANVSANGNSFVAGAIGPVTVTPTNGQLSSAQAATLQITPDFSKVAAGSVASAAVVLDFADGSTQTIPIQLLAPASSGYCSPLQIVNRSLQNGFSAFLGQPLALEVDVVDACGNPVNAGAGNPSVTGYLNQQSAFQFADVNGYETAVNLVSTGNGIWRGDFIPSLTGTVTAYFQASVQEGSATINGRSSAIGGSLDIPASTPPAAWSLVQAASELPVPIAPGELFTIYGQNLGSVTAIANSVPLPTNVGATQVTIGNQPAPLLYVGALQINAQVPYNVPVNVQYQATVQSFNASSVPFSVVIAAAQPGVFTLNQTGIGQGVIVKSDGVTLAQDASPARIGETVVIYCTGLGAVAPAVAAGTAAPSSPLARTVYPVSVSIGGQPAAVSFSGLTPGFVGLYQVNAVVPAGISTGNAVPVTLTVAGQTSPAVTMAVQ